MTVLPRRPLRSGLTLVEALAILAVIACLVWLLIPARKRVARADLCADRLRALHHGLRAYLASSNDCFPPAWHVAGPAVADDLGNLTYSRFAILEAADPSFRHRVSPRDVQRHTDNLLAARQEKYLLTRAFWRCPAKGWTDDYFAPAILFRTGERPAHFDEVTRPFTAADRPLLSDVNASFPDPEADDPKDPGHQHELRTGFSIVKESELDVFLGVGPSLRVDGLPTSSRLDFRHDRAANVLFLDGHFEPLKSDDALRLERLHRSWNHLHPAPGERSKP